MNNNEDDNVNGMLDESYNVSSINNSTWSQWAWDVLLGEDETFDEDGEMNNNNSNHGNDNSTIIIMMTTMKILAIIIHL